MLSQLVLPDGFGWSHLDSGRTLPASKLWINDVYDAGSNLNIVEFTCLLPFSQNGKTVFGCRMPGFLLRSSLQKSCWNRLCMTLSQDVLRQPVPEEPAEKPSAMQVHVTSLTDFCVFWKEKNSLLKRKMGMPTRQSLVSLSGFRIFFILVKKKAQPSQEEIILVVI